MKYEFSYDIANFDGKGSITIYAYGNGCTIELEENAIDEIIDGGDDVVLELFGDIIESYYKESL